MPCIPDEYLDCYLAETKQSLQFANRLFGLGGGGKGGGMGEGLAKKVN